MRTVTTLPLAEINRKKKRLIFLFPDKRILEVQIPRGLKTDRLIPGEKYTIAYCQDPDTTLTSLLSIKGESSSKTIW